MPIISLILTLVIIGVIMYVINTFIPMSEPIKRILNIVVIILVCIWLLSAFGIIGSLGSLGTVGRVR